MSQVASTHGKQRSEKYPEGTFRGSHVLWGFFVCWFVLFGLFCFLYSSTVSLISNNRQAVTNVSRDTHLSGDCKLLDLQRERQLKYKAGERAVFCEKNKCIIEKKFTDLTEAFCTANVSCSAQPCYEKLLQSFSGKTCLLLVPYPV